ncbi:hypothetical protein VR44_06700 [Streptomyces katrae]|uniref:Uncharacterized protein n=1 Tax=Streptomyces katrae TaxID=68223 RepID=A0A0F4JS93_9ACTN|nr:hypothetical protein VR44_06700 [Streptomyces katrae]
MCGEGDALKVVRVQRHGVLRLPAGGRAGGRDALAVLRPDAQLAEIQVEMGIREMDRTFERGFGHPVWPSRAPAPEQAAGRRAGHRRPAHGGIRPPPARPPGRRGGPGRDR